MLLAIDVGNTQSVLGVFNGAELAWHWRIATQAERTSDELALLFGGFLAQQGLSFSREITGVAIASVVPDQTHALRQMVREYFHFSPVVVEPGHGTAAEVDGVVERVQKELGGHATVIATGGLADAVLPHCTSVDHHDPWLTLKGLRLIFEKNTARDE